MRRAKGSLMNKIGRMIAGKQKPVTVLPLSGISHYYGPEHCGQCKGVYGNQRALSQYYFDPAKSST